MSRHEFCATSLGSIILVEWKRPFARNGSFDKGILTTCQGNESAVMTGVRGKLECFGRAVEVAGHA